MYALIFDEETIRSLKRLEKEISKRIFTKIQTTKQNPHRYYKKLKDRSEYRLRVGDYRVFADIDTRTITILTIIHRKTAYNP